MSSDTTHFRRVRAQTQIDFVVAVGLLVLLFGAAIGVLLPLEGATTDTTGGSTAADQIAADRIAAWVIDLLGTTTDGSAESPALQVASEPGTLSPVCSVAFFTADERLAASAGCSCTDVNIHELVDNSGLRLAVHELDDQPAVEQAVTLGVETNRGRITGRLDRSAAGSSATQPVDFLLTGSAVSSRVVSIDGHAYLLTVWVW